MNASTPIHSLSRQLFAFAIAALSLCALTVSARAADGVKHADKAFFEKAAKAGQAEVQISQVAVERATNPQIREYADMIVSEHQQLNSELTSLAAARGIALPTTDVKVDKWASKKAADFDKDYVKEMVDAHGEAVSLFEKASKSDDPEIAALAQKYLPKLQAHLTAAKDFKKMY